MHFLLKRAARKGCHLRHRHPFRSQSLASCNLNGNKRNFCRSLTLSGKPLAASAHPFANCICDDFLFNGIKPKKRLPSSSYHIGDPPQWKLWKNTRCLAMKIPANWFRCLLLHGRWIKWNRSHLRCNRIFGSFSDDKKMDYYLTSEFVANWPRWRKFQSQQKPIHP